MYFSNNTPALVTRPVISLATYQFQFYVSSYLLHIEVYGMYNVQYVYTMYILVHVYMCTCLMSALPRIYFYFVQFYILHTIYLRS